MKDPTNIKRDIIQNMRKYHSGKWVNAAVAIGNLQPSAFVCLDELVDEQLVERKYIYHNSRGAALYRYVDRSWERPHLTLISGGKKDE